MVLLPFVRAVASPRFGDMECLPLGPYLWFAPLIERIGTQVGLVLPLDAAKTWAHGVEHVRIAQFAENAGVQVRFDVENADLSIGEGDLQHVVGLWLNGPDA